jgi:hypothetical protein
MSDHNFNPFIAKKYGINEAVLINTFIFWTRTNAAKGDNFHNGRFWFYGTPEYFTKFFNYLNSRQLRYALTKLVKSGALLKSCFNKKAYDRTSWYSLSDNLLIELNLDRTCLNQATTLAGRHLTNLPDPFDKIVATIPVNKTQLIKNNKTLVDFKKSTSYRDDELFMQFYTIYPNRQKPEPARKAFYKHKPTKEFVEMLVKDVELRKKNNWFGRDKTKIPHPATYLNAKEWEGEIIHPESDKDKQKAVSPYRPEERTLSKQESEERARLIEENSINDAKKLHFEFIEKTGHKSINKQYPPQRYSQVAKSSQNANLEEIGGIKTDSYGGD